MSQMTGSLAFHGAVALLLWRLYRIARRMRAADAAGKGTQVTPQARALVVTTLGYAGLIAGVLLLEQTIVGPAHHPATHRKLDLIVWLALNQYLLLAAYAYWPAGKLGALLGGKGGFEGGAATSGVLKPKMMV